MGIDNRLPAGWDSELQEVRREIKKKERQRERLGKEMEGEMERVRLSYVARMPHDELALLRQREETTWAEIREAHPIPPPQVTEPFKHYDEAAQVLAHYWQGPEIDQNRLLRGIGGIGDNRLNAEAFQFAQNLTEPGSPARALVQRAQDFLWSGYSR